jgi:predicted transcriptional regulator
MDLSLIQKDILITLIALYEQKSIPVKGGEIAEIIRRSPGTVRNQMQALKASGLVDGIPGPRGGYHPTTVAFNLLNIAKRRGDVSVPISRNGEYLSNIRVLEVSFTTLSYADICHGVIRISGSVREFVTGDLITIGPTPVNKLMISGEVFGKDEREKALIISIVEMVSVPKKPAQSYMSSPVKMLSADSTVHDALSLFIQEHIHGAPVIHNNGNKKVLCGIVTMSDILRTVLEGTNLQTSVTQIMTGETITVDISTKLHDIIALFGEKEIGRFIVMEKGFPVGIITRSDVLRALTRIADMLCIT